MDDAKVNNSSLSSSSGNHGGGGGSSGAGSSSKPFLVGSVASPAGLTPLRSQTNRPEVMRSRKKVNKANRRHKKWLAELEKERKKALEGDE